MRKRTKMEKSGLVAKTEEYIGNENEKPKIQLDTKTSYLSSTTFILLTLATVVAVIGLSFQQIRSLHNEQLKVLEKALQQQVPQPEKPDVPINRPTAVVWSPRVKMTHLRHVFRVLERLGYKTVENNASDWDVLWAHDYPFHAWRDTFKTLRPHQKVNHFPGTGYVTTKVTLATSGGLHIPPAFRIPEDKDKLLKHAAEHPDVLFVEKNNDHRSVQLQKLMHIDLDASRGSFLQEFVARPLLVSGHKFDIGVYTIITSVDPLRIYKYNGDVLFRFCEEAYEPFNASNTAQYVIGEDYTPAWQVPALQIYTQLGYSARDAFDAHLRHSGKDPSSIWQQIDDGIIDVYLKREKQFTELVAKYSSRRSFFEMVRFDFIVDEDLQVYLLEANMSPNLSSMHYPPNALLYEQLLYSVFSLVGVSSYMQPPLTSRHSREDQNMAVTQHNLMVFPEECMACQNCETARCLLCKTCLNPTVLLDLRLAYLEHVNKLRCKRVFPPPMNQVEVGRGQFQMIRNLTRKNELMVTWFQGKCKLDQSWCQ